MPPIHTHAHTHTHTHTHHSLTFIEEQQGWVGDKKEFHSSGT